jgi:Flp pilus assembly pilin Flp
MKKLHEAVHRLSRGEKGQGMTEYIIIVAIIAIGAIVIVGLFGDAIRDRFNVALEALMGKDAKVGDVKADQEDLEKKWKDSDWKKIE